MEIGSLVTSWVFKTLSVWVSSHSSHHPQEVLLDQFSLGLYVCKGGLKPHLFDFICDKYSTTTHYYKILNGELICMMSNDKDIINDCLPARPQYESETDVDMQNDLCLRQIFNHNWVSWLAGNTKKCRRLHLVTKWLNATEDVSNTNLVIKGLIVALGGRSGSQLYPVASATLPPGQVTTHQKPSLWIQRQVEIR